MSAQPGQRVDSTPVCRELQHVQQPHRLHVSVTDLCRRARLSACNLSWLLGSYCAMQATYKLRALASFLTLTAGFHSSYSFLRVTKVSRPSGPGCKLSTGRPSQSSTASPALYHAMIPPQRWTTVTSGKSIHSCRVICMPAHSLSSRSAPTLHSGLRTANHALAGTQNSVSELLRVDTCTARTASGDHALTLSWACLLHPACARRRSRLLPSACTQLCAPCDT